MSGHKHSNLSCVQAQLSNFQVPPYGFVSLVNLLGGGGPGFSCQVFRSSSTSSSSLLALGGRAGPVNESRLCLPTLLPLVPPPGCSSTCAVPAAAWPQRCCTSSHCLGKPGSWIFVVCRCVCFLWFMFVIYIYIYIYVCVYIYIYTCVCI